MMENIKACNLSTHWNFPIKKDDGTLVVIKGYKVQHSHYKEPCKGGNHIIVYILYIIVLNNTYDTWTLVRLKKCLSSGQGSNV